MACVTATRHDLLACATWKRPLLLRSVRQRNLQVFKVLAFENPRLCVDPQQHLGPHFIDETGSESFLQGCRNKFTSHVRLLGLAALVVGSVFLWQGRAVATAVPLFSTPAVGTNSRGAHDVGSEARERSDAVLSRTRARAPLHVNEVASIAGNPHLQPHLPAIDRVDTAWMLTCTIVALVSILPGIALLYGTFFKAQWFRSVLLQHVAVASLAALIWVMIGYTLAFSTVGMVEGDIGWRSVIGTLDKAFLGGVTEASVFETVPEHLWATFQMLFAMSAPCIMITAFMQRMKLAAILVFSTLWSVLVYLPVAHSVWAGPGSLLGDMGTLDFAGGLVVHVSAGFSALMGSIILGRGNKKSPDVDNLPTFLIGTFMLWLGWTALNGGSALTPGATAAVAVINTQSCASAGSVTWLLLDWMASKALVRSACMGAVSGLVCIAPAAAFVGPAGAAAMGVLVASVSRWVSEYAQRTADLDGPHTFGVHGVGGFLGNILTGLFAHPFFGGNQVGMLIGSQVAVQSFSSMLVVLYSMLATCIIMAMTRVLCGGLSPPAESATGDGKMSGQAA